MKALLFESNKLGIKEINLPKRKKGEVTIKVIIAGLCHTDRALINGYKNFSGVLGHEFVGRIIDADSKDIIGKRVVADINIPCKKCNMCKKGKFHHCINRKTIGISNFQGVFAEMIQIPEDNIVFVPENLDDEIAVFAEPFAAALQIQDQIHIKSSSKIAIFGDGKLGQMIIRALSLTGAECTIIGKHKGKLEKAKKFGKTMLLKELNKDLMFDIVVDATGRKEGFDMALKHLIPGGVLALKTTTEGFDDFKLSDIVVNEYTILGSRCGDIKTAIRLLNIYDFNLKELIDGIEPLENFEKVFNHKGMKILFKIE